MFHVGDNANSGYCAFISYSCLGFKLNKGSKGLLVFIISEEIDSSNPFLEMMSCSFKLWRSDNMVACTFRKQA